MTPPTRSPNKTPSGSTTPLDSDARKRVVKACDRCRLKKIKTENTVCRYGERKKSIERRIPPGYVDYLEDQQKLLVMALKKSRAQGVSSSTAASVSALQSAAADPSVHSILEELGVLSEFPSHRSDESGFRFEEDLEILRQQCEEEDTLEQIQIPIASSPESLNTLFSQEDFSQEPWYQNLTPQPGPSTQLSGMEQQQQFQQTRNPQLPQSYQRTLPSQDPARRLSAQAATRQQAVNVNAPQQIPPDVSTVSPSDLTLPTALGSYTLPDEETWARWLNKRREASRPRQFSKRLSTTVGMDHDYQLPTPEDECLVPSTLLSNDCFPFNADFDDLDETMEDTNYDSAPLNNSRLNHASDPNDHYTRPRSRDADQNPDIKTEDDAEYIAHLGQVLASSEFKAAMKMEAERFLRVDDQSNRNNARTHMHTVKRRRASERDMVRA
ncbi:MAG: hypothetical protein M1828_003736 [Chrysothrix sp. TS-e1954]|nr:MAG: hypothetical protein M1828_003736 [Chrysothrix sp. TS-e1954]